MEWALSASIFLLLFGWLFWMTFRDDGSDDDDDDRAGHSRL